MLPDFPRFHHNQKAILFYAFGQGKAAGNFPQIRTVVGLIIARGQGA
jgi:hypothetical protein